MGWSECAVPVPIAFSQPDFLIFSDDLINEQQQIARRTAVGRVFYLTCRGYGESEAYASSRLIFGVLVSKLCHIRIVDD